MYPAQSIAEVVVESLAAIPRRSEAIRTFKEGGGLVAAVLPIHYPRALLRAFNVLPVEVWGPPGVDASFGAAHLQPYVCSIVRNALSFLQAGGLDEVDFIIVPHACDSLQGLGSLLIDFVHPKQPVIPLYLPRGARASDAAFLAEELRSVYHRLEEVTLRSPPDAQLLKSVQREEAADRLFSELYQRRRQLAVAQIEFYRLIRSREYLAAEVFRELAQSVLAQASPPPPDPPLARRRTTGEGELWKGIPIVLSGILPEPMSLFESIAEMGGVVVADDLACCGRRVYPPGQSDDPFRRMAESLLAAPPDPMRGSPIQDRLDHLLRLTRSSGAKGVVLYDVKFCEPELYDLPDLRRGLQEAGIPSTAVQVDLNDPLAHQTLTRLEAFLEMIA
jgi:benzoyl-CoA reductase/2-hydroxyglutaryl-CoA dehydratase subunit BcrC/BadD/HgdB